MRRTRALVPAVALVVVVLSACGSTATSSSSGTTRASSAATQPRPRSATDEAATDPVVDDGAGTTLAPTASDLAGAGTSLPIVFKDFGNGYRKPTVAVSVGGGTAVPVLLDTGSTGLHVLGTSAGSAGVTTTSVTLTETYADGSQYSGPAATAPVTIGGVASSQPIALMLIDTVGCTAASPDCPTPNVAALEANGVYGTMGVSLSPSSGCAAPLFSPLLQLPGGETGFSVGFTASGGTVVLGNTPPMAGGQPLALGSSAYTGPASPTPASSGSTCAPSGSSSQYPNGSGVWDVSSAQACWSLGGSTPVCGATTFDTGSEDVGVTIGSFPGVATTGSMVNAGVPVVLSAPNAGATLWSFTAGTAPGSNRVQTSSPAPSLLATTGSAFYFSGWVTYDAENGRLVVTPSA